VQNLDTGELDDGEKPNTSAASVTASGFHLEKLHKESTDDSHGVDAGVETPTCTFDRFPEAVSGEMSNLCAALQASTDGISRLERAIDKFNKNASQQSGAALAQSTELSKSENTSSERLAKDLIQGTRSLGRWTFGIALMAGILGCTAGWMDGAIYCRVSQARADDSDPPRDCNNDTTCRFPLCLYATWHRQRAAVLRLFDKGERSHSKSAFYW
jgi:hypothetical protein